MDDIQKLNDREFDLLLQSTMEYLPPEDVAQAVTPWRTAMNRILTGLALTGITLNFLCLNYLLPAIGTLLILLGFRALRRENKWFRACWMLTLFRAVCYYPTLILNATIYQAEAYATPFASIVSALSLGATLALMFCFWKALRQVQEKAGLEPHAGGALGMLFWYAALIPLAYLGNVGWIIGIVVLLAYVLMLRSLWTLTGELDEAGYSVTPAPVRVTDSALVTAVTVGLLMGILCGYLFCRCYPTDWELFRQPDSAEIIEIKAHLTSLGFPEAILEDLTEEDLLACRDAKRVVVDAEDFPMNHGREVATTEPYSDYYDASDGSRYIMHIRTVYDKKELRVTGIGVELPGDREEWRIFHHFHWTMDPGFRGTEGILIWPAHNNGQGWHLGAEPTGQLLYSRDGQTFRAPFHSLESGSYTSSSLFFGEQTTQSIRAGFSLPGRGTDPRGYITYTVQEVQDGWIIDSWFNYTHQQTPLQYPVYTAESVGITLSIGDAAPFLTIQDALQFFPNDEPLAPLN